LYYQRAAFKDFIAGAKWMRSHVDTTELSEWLKAQLSVLATFVDNVEQGLSMKKQEADKLRAQVEELKGQLAESKACGAQFTAMSTSGGVMTFDFYRAESTKLQEALLRSEKDLKALMELRAEMQVKPDAEVEDLKAGLADAREVIAEVSELLLAERKKRQELGKELNSKLVENEQLKARVTNQAETIMNHEAEIKCQARVIELLTKELDWYARNVGF